MIDVGAVIRADERAVHHIGALGLVLAAYVLGHDDVAGLGEFAEGRRQCQRRVRARRPFHELGGAVGRAVEDHGGVRGALGNDDDREQLHAIAHRDHHFALLEIHQRGHRLELLGDVAAHGRCVRRGGGGPGMQCENGNGSKKPGRTHDTSGRFGSITCAPARFHAAACGASRQAPS